MKNFDLLYKILKLTRKNINVWVNLILIYVIKNI